jgi:hypothetical protein
MAAHLARPRDSQTAVDQSVPHEIELLDPRRLWCGNHGIIMESEYNWLAVDMLESLAMLPRMLVATPSLQCRSLHPRTYGVTFRR